MMKSVLFSLYSGTCQPCWQEILIIDVTNIDVIQIVLGKQSYPLYCGGQDLLYHGERINRFVSVHHLHRYGW